jgi:hypothetical protein
MAHINDCVPGAQAKVVRSGVVRVDGKVGTIVEVSRVMRTPATAVKDTVTVDVTGHGEIVVAPDDLEMIS